MAKKSKNGKWYFLLVVFIGFVAVYFFSEEKFRAVFHFFINMIVQMLPILLLVFLLMILVNYFADNAFIKKHMGKEAGFKRWLFIIVAGVISIGPVYMWYPLMKNLREKGIQNRFLVAFLYNRGIKLQWLPLLILYFGLKFSLTLMFVMVLFSIPQGIIVEKLIGKEG